MASSPSKAGTATPGTITLSQQAVNLARQIAGAPGWAKTPSDLYLGGKLVVETLPELDSISWIKTPEQVARMTEEQQRAYAAKDTKWATTEKTFSISDKEKEAFGKAFSHFVSEGKLQPSKWINELITAFGIKVDE